MFVLESFVYKNTNRNLHGPNCETVATVFCSVSFCSGLIARMLFNLTEFRLASLSAGEQVRLGGLLRGGFRCDDGRSRDRSCHRHRSFHCHRALQDWLPPHCHSWASSPDHCLQVIVYFVLSKRFGCIPLQTSHLKTFSKPRNLGNLKQLNVNSYNDISHTFESNLFVYHIFAYLEIWTL